MSLTWRDQILKEFAPKVARLTLVADPDGLLLEEGILAGIRDRGFELVPFEDHVAFRYAYESKFRSRWDRGEQTELVVVLRSAASNLSSLPYDLLQVGRKLSFGLGDVFPNLGYPVVTALDRGDLDALYEAQRNHAPGLLGDNATKEFVLRHVFEIAPELVKQPPDLLRVLLRRHYRGQRIPTILDARFIQLLRQSDSFREWPLETIVPDREAFLGFLQERWPVFLDRMATEGDSSLRERRKPYDFVIDGPIDLPFEHHDVRVYIDNLFLEGLLRPVGHEHARDLGKTWVATGLKAEPSEDLSRRMAKLLESLRVAIPDVDARHTEWLHFARGWAELVLLSNEPEVAISDAAHGEIETLRAQVDANFTPWLAKRFAGLVNLPSTPPVMLHHLPRFLDRQIGEERGSKAALIIVDGLSLDQWLVIRGALVSQERGYVLREHAVFAWIPSITSVSRQAAFAGKPPVFFPSSIQTTDKEPTLWKQFWADQGLAVAQVVYMKGLGDGSLEPIAEALSHPQARVAGLVIDKVDKIMHGMELGTAGMHNQVRQWAQQPYLTALIDLLLGKGFSVYLTSDHGNVEAQGCGRPAEGAVADLRGERVRIYPDTILRQQVKESFPSAIEWEPIGLPDCYMPLIASGRQSFVLQGKKGVVHGGLSIEEIIVPFVHIERRAG